MVIFIYVLAGLGMGAWLVWGWGGIGCAAWSVLCVVHVDRCEVCLELTLWDVVVVLRVDVPAGGLC